MLARPRRVAIGVFSDNADLIATLEQLQRIGARNLAIYSLSPESLSAPGSTRGDVAALPALLTGTVAASLTDMIKDGSAALCADISESATEARVAGVLLASHAKAVQLHDCSQ